LFVGFHHPDKGNYGNQSPCYCLEGDGSSEVLTNWKRGMISDPVIRKISF